MIPIYYQVSILNEHFGWHIEIGGLDVWNTSVSLTHYNLVLLFCTHWKHEKTFRLTLHKLLIKHKLSWIT